MGRLLHTLLLLLLIVLFTTMVVQCSAQVQTRSQMRRALQSSCGVQQNTHQCQEQLPRDLMFLVDASDTIDRARFYGEMLDFLQDIYCALNVNQINRGALITFGQTVTTRIPLQQYTPEQWFDSIDAVRSDETLCCSCCTPLAEALDLARRLFVQNPQVGDISPVRLVVIITDGAVWQNTGNQPGYWSWPEKATHAKYKYQIVPTEATRLKNLDPNRPVRLMVLGVPSGTGSVFSNTAYFTGAGIGKSTIKCEKRRNERDCVVASTPPFPIVSMPLVKNVFSATSWNITKMIHDTVPDLCEITTTGSPVITKSPIPHPSKAPSRAPTLPAPSHSPTVHTMKPTPSPTENELFSGLDVFIFMDRSKSMVWRADTCRRAPGGNLHADDAHVCWELFLRFTSNLVTDATNMGFIGHANFGWQDEWTNKTRGIRAWVYGFACTDGQKKPIVERIAEKVSNQADFDAAIAMAKSLTPSGGTCPGAAMERALGMLMANDLIDRPYKVALMLTDGVFYDSPKPQKASQGFAQLGILTYALGISIADNGQNYGLSPKEIATQRSQLLAFVNGERDRLMNFGEEGLFILDDIAKAIIKRLPKDVAQNFPRILKKPYWCGFSSAERCLNTNPETFETAKYCKWIPRDWSKFNGLGKCLDQDWCNWRSKATCQQDTYCTFAQGKCLFNNASLPGLKLIENASLLLTKILPNSSFRHVFFVAPFLLRILATSLVVDGIY